MKSPPKIKTISINVVRQRLRRDHGIVYLEEGEFLYPKIITSEVTVQSSMDVDADLTTDEMAAVDAYMVLGHGEILAARFDHCRAGPLKRAEWRRLGVSPYDMTAVRKVVVNG